MKKIPALFVILALCAACNTNGDSASGDKDSINAIDGADTITQNRLNADTSANSNGGTARDSVSTDTAALAE